MSPVPGTFWQPCKSIDTGLSWSPKLFYSSANDLLFLIWQSDWSTRTLYLFAKSGVVACTTNKPFCYHPGVEGPFRKSWKLFRSEKASLKLRPACPVKLVFSHDVKGRKIKITAKFRVLERLRFHHTKSQLCYPKRFGTFEKRAPGSQKSQHFSDLFQAPQFSGPESSRDFRETGPRPKSLEALQHQLELTTTEELTIVTVDGWRFVPNFIAISPLNFCS